MFAEYREAIRSLPSGRLERDVLQTDTFLVEQYDQISIFYAPFDAIEPRARVVLVGITPGWEQMRLAFEAARDALTTGQSDEHALRAAKATGSFAGMRNRLIAWLDELGVNTWLDIDSTSALFDDRGDLLHTTSAVRYPVFIGPDHANYSGSSPSLDKTPKLLDRCKTLLVPELASLKSALVVPLGSTVSRTLEAIPGIEMSKCLLGFPHPSGANGWANRHFAEAKDRMTEQVRNLD